ncbi:lipopolysaccharide biosynthesis protein [Chloroflexota bacterium]
MSLAQRTVKGVFWAYITFFSGRFVTLITTVILARILVPADFGLIGWALLCLGFIEATRDFGIMDALIYTSERIEDSADTAFWSNIGIGILQFAVAYIAAPLSLYFIDDPRIVDILRVMSLVFILNSLGNTHDALLQKDLKFRLRYMPMLYSAFIKGVASVILAFLGFGVWSLVLGHVIGAVVRLVARWLLIDWRPRFRFFMDRARALWGYGIYILLFSVLEIALEFADQLIIGILLGEVQLGYYTIAARIPEMLILNFSMVLGRVIFPTFVRMKDDLANLTLGFLTTTKYTALITVPASLGLVAVAPELVYLFFGPQWSQAIPFFRVLSLLAMVGTLSWSAGDVFKAVGRPDISTKLLVVEALYTFPIIWMFGTMTGNAVMASVGNLIAACISMLLRLGLVAYFLKATPTLYTGVFRSALFGAFTMFGAVLLWRSQIPAWGTFPTLVSSVVVGIVIYVPILWLLERDELWAARDMLVSILRRDTTASIETVES